MGLGSKSTSQGSGATTGGSLGQGRLGSTWFLGGDRDVLGFDNFHEIGVSLGIGRYAAGVLAVYGEDVEGWNLTFNYNY